MPKGAYRESERSPVPPGRGRAGAEGKRFIAVIGIDRYRRWSRLNNAVGDARGVFAAFRDLGFAPAIPPLLDEAATGEAIRGVATDMKPVLGYDDSLVVFFAGHGHIVTVRFAGDPPDHLGYLIPVDGDGANGRDDTWQDVDHWLSTIARLPPRHILVILDSCYSGITLSSAVRHRGQGVRSDGTEIPFHERRSRRVITSTMSDQRARDDGPVAGHSLFTGYLIEALSGGRGAWREQPRVGVLEIRTYVTRHVQNVSHDTQVPGEGVLEYDNAGELFVLPKPDVVVNRPQSEDHRPQNQRASQSGSRAHRPEPAAAAVRSATVTPAQPPALVSRPPVPEPAAADAPDSYLRLPTDRTEGWSLDPAVAAALDRQGEERKNGAQVLSVIAGDPLATQTMWGTWAAGHGYLTLATESVGIAAVIADLLAQTPWLRCVPEARRRLATAARLDVHAIDASLDAHSASQRATWINDIAALDHHALVSGWLLSSLRQPKACVPDLTTAPVEHGELLAIACDLASPTAVLLRHATPDAAWLEQAVVTAAELTAYMPGHSVAVMAPDELVTATLRDRRRGSAWSMARQGLVRVEALATRRPGRARRSTMRALFEALAQDPRTRGRFELDARIAVPGEPAIAVELVCQRARTAVELDSWYHFFDPDAYRRDRRQDLRLQRAGYFVLRFPAEDVDDRLASTIEQLAIALASRRASVAPV